MSKLAPTWDQIDVKLAQVGSKLAQIGTKLAPSWAKLVPCWDKNGRKNNNKKTSKNMPLKSHGGIHKYPQVSTVNHLKFP